MGSNPIQISFKSKGCSYLKIVNPCVDGSSPSDFRKEIVAQLVEQRKLQLAFNFGPLVDRFIQRTLNPWRGVRFPYGSFIFGSLALMARAGPR